MGFLNFVTRNRQYKLFVMLENIFQSTDKIFTIMETKLTEIIIFFTNSLSCVLCGN